MDVTRSMPMNNVTTFLAHAQTPAEFAQRYFAYIPSLLQRIDLTALTAWIEILEMARQRHRTIFVAGNGGSASTAAHMATDFGYGLPMGAGSQPVRMVALTENLATVTALANDRGYPDVFVSQLRVLYRPGDVLIVVSASGNSPNVVAAAAWVKERKGTVLGLLGFDGGELLKRCDVAVHVKTPTGEYGPVEDVHLILNHLMSTWLRHQAASRSRETWRAHRHHVRVRP